MSFFVCLSSSRLYRTKRNMCVPQQQQFLLFVLRIFVRYLHLIFCFCFAAPEGNALGGGGNSVGVALVRFARVVARSHLVGPINRQARGDGGGVGWVELWERLRKTATTDRQNERHISPHPSISPLSFPVCGQIDPQPIKKIVDKTFATIGNFDSIWQNFHSRFRHFFTATKKTTHGVYC